MIHHGGLLGLLIHFLAYSVLRRVFGHVPFVVLLLLLAVALGLLWWSRHRGPVRWRRGSKARR